MRGDFPSDRGYLIVRNMVLIITIVTGMSAVYYAYIMGIDAINKAWQGHCSQYNDFIEFFNCMQPARWLMDEYRKLLCANIAIAVLLPILFSVIIWIPRRERINKQF